VKTVVTWLASIVRRAPVATIIAVLVPTVVLGAFVPQLAQTNGIEVFVPDNPELQAMRVIDERFGGQETTVQILIESPNGDVITAEGLQTVVRAEDAIGSLDPTIPLAETATGPIVSFLSPTMQLLQLTGTSADSATDEEVKAAFSQSLDLIPTDQRALFEGLVSTTSTDLTEARTGTGLMVVVLDASGMDVSTLQEAEARIAEAAAKSGIGDTTATAFASEMLLSVDPLADELPRMFALAAAAIAVILASVYWIRPKDRKHTGAALRRALADLGLTLSAIGISIAWVLGTGVLLGPKYLGLIGDFSPVLQILPVLLVGLGVDFAIHLTSRYREEVGTGWDVEAAAQRAITTVGIALVLATATTAVGFLTNVANPIPPLKDFGILAAIGIIGAFLIAMTLVPAVRVLLDRRAERAGRLPRSEFERPERRLAPTVMSKLALISEHFAVPTLVIAVGLAVLGAFGMSRLPTEFNATDFVPADDPLRTSYETLNAEFDGGLGASLDVLIEGDVTTADFHNALVAATANLAETDGVIVVDGQAAATSPLSVIAGLVAIDAAGSPADPDFAALAVTNGMRADLTMDPGADVATIYRAALASAPDAMSAVFDPGDGGSGAAARMGISTSAEEGDAGRLAADVTADLRPVSELAGMAVTPTSVAVVSASVVTALQDSQNTSLAITLVAAMLLLVVTFWVESRRPLLGVITILPVAFVVVWTFGMMHLVGIPFGPVTAMTAALAIGIGVPYSIHITHRYLEDRERFDDPEAAMRSTIGQTGGALAGSALTTLAGFAVLMTSDLVPFRQFGAVTTLAIGFSLIAAVAVLPSMLALSDRWHGRRLHAAERSV